ncbi:Protein FAR1-RELATED SEQUENCE 5 [Zea mays]|uniref:Protein FAR1-RELATED SEQUENCE n=1 Tax=Zea mays TaxID=4577 RepID=A0A3L6EWU7_MAIZE|nr:Protein FAR1-RELATED SEQUENCE 5 [Zea mays]
MMEPQVVDLEDDSINFWASLGVSPHVDQMPLHSVHIVDHQAQPALAAAAAAIQPQSVCRDLFPVESDACLEPRLGMEFESGEAAKTFYIAYAGRVGFSVRIARSRKSKCSESIIMLRFVCSREGFSKEKRVVTAGKKTRKRPASIREGCNAMLEVLRRGDSKWIVTKLVKEHNHEVGLPSRVQYIAIESDTVVDPYIGMEFESLESAKTFYYSYASRVGFEARVRQSRKSQDESLKMLKLVCSRHRYHSGRESNGEDTKRVRVMDPSRDGCDALFEIIRKGKDTWTVSKLILEHTHELKPAPASRVHCVRSQELNRGMAAAVAKVLPNTHHIFCERHILDTMKEDLHGTFPDPVALVTDLRKCIDGSRIEELFDSGWNSVIIKHELSNNELLQSLYDIRQRWAPAYTKNVFYPRNLMPTTFGSIEKAIQKYFSSKTELRVAVCQLGQVISSSFEAEVQADYFTMFQMPALSTASPVEKQGSSIFTSTIFGLFQGQFVDSFGYHAERLEDDTVHKYRVNRYEGDEEIHTVYFNPDQGVHDLPKAYILKRWTKHAKNIDTSDNYIDLRGGRDDPSTARFNDLFCHVVKFAKEGSKSAEIYAVAKDSLSKAFDEVVQSSKNFRGQQNLQSYTMSLKRSIKKFGKGRDSSDKSSKRSASKHPLMECDDVDDQIY